MLAACQFAAGMEGSNVNLCVEKVMSAEYVFVVMRTSIRLSGCRALKNLNNQSTSELMSLVAGHAVHQMDKKASPQES